MAGNGVVGSGGVLRDEQGHPSMARRLLLAWTPNIIALVWVDVIFQRVPNQVWVALVPIYMVLIGWAVGPRIFQYVGPRMAAIGSAIASARQKGTDRYTDDER